MTATICRTTQYAPAFTEGRDAKTLGFVSWPRRLILVLYVWQRRSKERQHLAMMSDQLLADIGISYVEAMQEAAKPFWKP